MPAPPLLPPPGPPRPPGWPVGPSVPVGLATGLRMLSMIRAKFDVEVFPIQSETVTVMFARPLGRGRFLDSCEIRMTAYPSRPKSNDASFPLIVILRVL